MKFEDALRLLRGGYRIRLPHWDPTSYIFLRMPAIAGGTPQLLSGWIGDAEPIIWNSFAAEEIMSEKWELSTPTTQK